MVGEPQRGITQIKVDIKQILKKEQRSFLGNLCSFFSYSISKYWIRLAGAARDGSLKVTSLDFAESAIELNLIAFPTLSGLVGF
jgi:hypothetical protein